MEITVKYLTIKDPMGLARTAWFICEGGRPTGFYGYPTEEAAQKQAEAMKSIRRASR